MGKNKYVRYVPILAGSAFVLVIAVILITAIRGFLDKPVQTKKMVQQISLIQPPPPPPPKVEEKPPEPVVEEKIVEPEPEQTPDQPADNADVPPGDNLGLDADGGAGGDAFGLVGRKGGRDFLAGSGARGLGWYSTVIKSDIQEFLYDHSTVRKKRFNVDVRLWVDAEGKVKRFELLKSSGDHETDQALKTALASYAQLREKPPEDMPHSFTVRIISRI